MKTPKGLQPLIDDGVIDEVLRPLKSGKEASVYVVRCGRRHPLRQGLQGHGAAQLPAARAVPGRAQGARQPRGTRDRQGQQVRAQAAGNGLEEHRGRCPVTSCRAAGVRVPRALRLLPRRAGDGAGHRRRRHLGAAPGRSRAVARGGARVLHLPDPAGGDDAVLRPDPWRPVGIQRAGCAGRPGDHRLPAGGQRRRQQCRARHAAARRQQPRCDPVALRARVAGDLVRRGNVGAVRSAASCVPTAR